MNRQQIVVLIKSCIRQHLIQTGFSIDFKILSADFADWPSKSMLLVASNELDFDMTNIGGILESRFLDSDNVLYAYDMETLEKYAPHAIPYLKRKQMEKYSLDANGRLRLIPIDADPSGSAVSNFLPWIRKDLLDQAGMGVPKTMSELETALKAFRGLNPDIVAIDSEYPSWILDWMFYGLSVPAKQTDENGDPLPRIGSWFVKSPEFKEYLATMSRLYKEGYFGSELFIWDGNKHVENRNAGNTGVWVDGWWMQRSFDKVADLLPDNPRPEGVPYMNWAPFAPAADDGRPMLQGYAPPSDSNFNCYFTYKWAKNPEACLAIVDWASASADNYILARFGIEGKQWQLKDNAIAVIPGNEGSYVSILADLLIYPKMGEIIERQWKGERDDFMIAYDHKNTKVAYPLDTKYLFNFERLGTLPTDLNDIVNERVTAFIIGDLPLDAVDQMIADLDAAGLQTYIDEKNRQWREFEADAAN